MRMVLILLAVFLGIPLLSLGAIAWLESPYAPRARHMLPGPILPWWPTKARKVDVPRAAVA